MRKVKGTFWWPAGARETSIAGGEGAVFMFQGSCERDFFELQDVVSQLRGKDSDYRILTIRSIHERHATAVPTRSSFQSSQGLLVYP